MCGDGKDFVDMYLCVCDGHLRGDEVDVAGVPDAAGQGLDVGGRRDEPHVPQPRDSGARDGDGTLERVRRLRVGTHLQ